jgi:predicted extracellular nuclease
VIRTRTIPALLALTVFGAFASSAQAATIQITEWMYQGANDTGEFIEFTNLGTTAVDMTGWSFDDDSRNANTVSLSGFGIVNAGESVILTESTAAAFRANWNLSANVDVIGGNSTNLGRADEINLFDSTGTLVDRLTYGDQSGLGPRTQGKSAVPHALGDLDSTTAAQWVLAAVGDTEGSYASAAGEIGNPGKSAYAPAPVPVPAAAWLFMSGLGALGAFKKRRAANNA